MGPGKEKINESSCKWCGDLHGDELRGHGAVDRDIGNTLAVGTHEDEGASTLAEEDAVGVLACRVSGGGWVHGFTQERQCDAETKGREQEAWHTIIRSILSLCDDIDQQTLI